MGLGEAGCCFSRLKEVEALAVDTEPVRFWTIRLSSLAAVNFFF